MLGRVKTPCELTGSERAIPLDDVVLIAEQIAEALEVVHGAELMSWDLKLD